MPTTPRRDAPSPAFDRLFGLAVWTQAQREPFSLGDVREAFPRDYTGAFAAVDRKWSRDKRALARLGLELEHLFDGHYLVSRACRPARPPARAGDLADRVRRLPPGDHRLEMGLRKLLAAGAPIGPALVERARAARALPPPPPSVPGLERSLGVAYALLLALQAAGRAGLGLEAALALSGARGERELRAALQDLDRATLPLEPPLDAVCVAEEGGRLLTYHALPYVMPLRPTPPEAAALEAALGDGRLEPLAA